MITRKTLLGAFVVTALAIGLTSYLPEGVGRAVYAYDSAQATAAEQGLRTAPDLSAAFEKVAQIAGPSVVNISSAKRIAASGSMQQLPDDLQNSPLKDFFGDDMLQHFFRFRTPRRGFVQRGLGTGVIVSKDGYILTNNHVVDGADELSVTLPDGRSFKAQTIGTDSKTDLAVIKIDADNLHPATLGDSDALKVGEWVVAAGDPFGLSNTITAGIVSAKGRSNMGIVDYEDFIQTDAAINPGNSGGPLLNLHGEVVGINSAIFTRSGGYMGIGLSIPINMAKSVMDSLIDTGKVVRGYLGVVIQELDPDMAKSFDYDSTDGALVAQVSDGGPADKAGINTGDIITGYNGDQVTGVIALRSAVAETKPGSNAKLQVFRDGKEKEITVKIGELDAQTVALAGQSSTADLGMTLRTLTPELARQLDATGEQGVLVSDVDQLGDAAHSGIQTNDIILKVQGVAVGSVAEFQKELSKHDLAKGVRLTVQTGTNQRFVLLRSQDQNG